MNKKLFALFVMLAMVIGSFVIAPSDLEVEAFHNEVYEATRYGEDISLDLDYGFIHYVTETLSDIIKTNPKGRDFGTPGEEEAADFILTWMNNNCSLGNAQFDKIENRWYPGKVLLYGNQNLTDKLEVISKSLTVHDHKNNTSMSFDCFITPRRTSEDGINWKDGTFSFTDLKVVKNPDEDFSGCIGWIASEAENDFSLDGSLSLDEFVEDKFAEYYNFSWGEIDKNDNETWPSYLRDMDLNISENFILFGVNKDYNPNYDNPGLRPISFFIYKLVNTKNPDRSWRKCFPEYYKGKILYDFHSDCHDTRATIGAPLNTIYINGSDGENKTMNIGDFKDNILENCTVDFSITQEFDNNVKSDNVIGKIEGDSNDVVIVSSLYDSLWTHGVADSAIGIGIVLAIAKYMKQLNELGITPKYDVKFIAFGGEEYGYRGANHYQAKHKTEYIHAVIDLNQLGFKQIDPVQQLTTHICTNRLLMVNKLRTIADITNYNDRVDNTIVSPEYFPIGSLSNDFAFAIPSALRLDCKTVLFLKDFGWTRHHKDGLNHTVGDTMDYYDPDDVKATTQMVWNVTKYFTIDPHCWIVDDSVVYSAFDTNNDGKNDSVWVNLTIDTIMPHERVLLAASLRSEDHLYRLLYSNTSYSNLILGRSGINTNITVSLNESDRKGDYNLTVNLYNSTGEIDRLNVNLAEVLGLNAKFANDSWQKTFELFPPNNCSDVGNPLGQNEVTAMGAYYNATATDQDGDMVSYQWKFKDPEDAVEYSNWTRFQSSGSIDIVRHNWSSTGTAMVWVRVRDEHMVANDCMQWAGPLYILVRPGGSFETFEFSLKGKSLNASFRNVESGDDEGDVDWGDNCSDDVDFPLGGQGPVYIEHTYNSVGVKNVSLRLWEDESGNATWYNGTIIILNVISDFNASDYSVRPYEDINFTNLAEASDGFSIVNHTWDFGDGSVSYEENATHNYSSDGEYTVKLTMKAEKTIGNYTIGTGHSCNKTVYIDSVAPVVIYVYQAKGPYGLGRNDVTFNTYVFDKNSGVESVYINITSPVGIHTNESMSSNGSVYWDYEYYFDDTWDPGQYNYTIWTTDMANNTVSAPGFDFFVSNMFGGQTSYTGSPSESQDVDNRLTGTAFYCYENGTADNITAHIKSSNVSCKAKCMIFYLDNMSLLGTTEEKTVFTYGSPFDVTFEFTGSKPRLKNDTWYLLCCYSNESCDLYYYNVSQEIGRYRDQLYNSNITSGWRNESRYYILNCNYTTKPGISKIVQSSDTVGYGFYVNVSASVTDESDDVSSVKLNLTYPNNTSNVFVMDHVGDTEYYYNFSDTWTPGQYNYTIMAWDRMGNYNSTSQYSFNVTVNASISVCTIVDSYGGNETINLTDPPTGSPQEVGYELLDNNSVLRIWNKYDNYYFNTSNGIQLTNHYDDYWSHNVLMLGYYNNDEWNLIYRTDELSGFNKNIVTDNSTYVNATLWKNLSYGGYDFRLAIRYHLGVNDRDLSIIPYIKNLGSAIPYTLGFAWEINDIQIDMTTEDDFIEINGTSYYLNQTINETYADMKIPIYCYNETLNETVVCDYEPIPFFHIREEISGKIYKSLYLKWDSSLDYKVRVKSRAGEYNAPVTLGIKIGTLAVNQSKHTTLHWYDAEQRTYYFNHYDSNEAWTTNPSSMVNGNDSSYTSTTSDGDIEFCDGNNCSGSDLGIISKVEIRVKGYRYYNGSIKLRPVFRSGDGDNHGFSLSSQGGWSQWYDITSDTNAPGSWTWADVRSLRCDVEASIIISGLPPSIVYCSQVEVQVTYLVPAPPSIYNIIPINGSNKVKITPVLSISVLDENNDVMNITWSSNSSGSWEVFGTNNSVYGGTYRQTFANATENGKWWYWKVNVSDGSNYTESGVLKFYTGVQSKISNTGNTNISGYLHVYIEYYNASSGNFSFDRDVLYTPVVINSSEELGIDTLFNGLLNTDDLIHGNGTYYVYAKLEDPYSNVLISCFEDGKAKYMEASWKFTVTYD
jgi:peptidase M28-like protein/PKD domain-containing protein